MKYGFRVQVHKYVNLSEIILFSYLPAITNVSDRIFCICYQTVNQNNILNLVMYVHKAETKDCLHHYLGLISKLWFIEPPVTDVSPTLPVR